MYWVSVCKLLWMYHPQSPVLTGKVRAVHIRGLLCLMGFWKWASSPSLGDFPPPLFQSQALVLLWQSRMESCSVRIRISELHRIGWTGARVIHPTSGILKYHSIQITGSKLGLGVMWTLFLSDSLWQVVGVGLGLQEPYPNFHGGSPWGMKRVVRLFLHFCNSFFLSMCSRQGAFLLKGFHMTFGIENSLWSSMCIADTKM